MLIVPSDKSWGTRSWWKKLWDKILKREWTPTWSNKSWRDSLGRTVLAWIAYDRPEELFDALFHCVYFHWRKTQLFRHPKHKEEHASRDHWSYWLIFNKIHDRDPHAFENLPRMRGLNLWMKSLAGKTGFLGIKAISWYYFWNIPFARIGNLWLRICRWAGKIGPERDNNWWIDKEVIDTLTLGEYIGMPLMFPVYGEHSNGLNLQHSRTPWQKLWGWIILNTIPAYSLHIKAWQIYVLPESRKKEKLKRILLSRIGISNIMMRLLLEDRKTPNSGDNVTQEEIDNYPAMTGYRPGVYLDESCRRDIREMTPEEAEFNNYEVELIKYLWNEISR